VGEIKRGEENVRQEWLQPADRLPAPGRNEHCRNKEIELSSEAQPQLIQVWAEQVELVAPLFDAYRQFYGQSPNLEGARQFLAERLRQGQSVIFAEVQDGRALPRESP
jgi:hypothetical protein